MTTRKITCTVEVDGEIYIFTIQRELGRDGNLFNDLTVTSSPNLPKKIQGLIDDLFCGHAPTTL
jgi:hypothetical protein